MGKNKRFVEHHEPEVKDELLKEETEKMAEEILKPETEVIKDAEVVDIVEVDGVVDNVTKSLNVRREPKVEPNNQVGILEKGTKVIVMKPKEPIQANGEHWFKIKFGEPVMEGYAMKKYIRIL